MVGDGLVREVEWLGELTDGRLAPRQSREDCPPRPVAEGGESGVQFGVHAGCCSHGFHGIYKLMFAQMIAGISVTGPPEAIGLRSASNWRQAPPTPAPSLAAIGVAALVLCIGQLVVFRTAPRQLGDVLGLGRPAGSAVALAVAVGAVVFGTYLVGAAALGVDLDIRPQWPSVLIGSLLFHGVAEELVWRGYAFGHLRRVTTFRRAVLGSMPLIAATHVPIIAGNGWLIGGLAVVSAAVTCLPLAYLWERGGRIIWAAAVLHGLIGTWHRGWVVPGSGRRAPA